MSSAPADSSAPPPAGPPDGSADVASSRRFAWRDVREHLRTLAPLISLLALLVFFAFTARGFVGWSTVRQVLEQGALLAIVAAGLTFVLLCGEIDLSVGAVATLTACLCGYMVAGWPAPESVSIGEHVASLALPLLVALATGALAGMFTVGSRLPSFIITLAMMNIAQGSARYLSGGQQFTKLPPSLIEAGQSGLDAVGVGAASFELPFTIPYSAMLAALVMLIGHVVLQHTRFGRYVYMTGGNREAARLAGVRTGAIVAGCLAISAACAGVGGLISAGRLGSVSPADNSSLLLDAVACVVLGGTSLFGGEGSMRRTLLGVLTYVVLDVGLNRSAWVDSHGRMLLMGVVLLTALVVNGLLSRRR